MGLFEVLEYRAALNRLDARGTAVREFSKITGTGPQYPHLGFILMLSFKDWGRCRISVHNTHIVPPFGRIIIALPQCVRICVIGPVL